MYPGVSVSFFARAQRQSAIYVASVRERQTPIVKCFVNFVKLEEEARLWLALLIVPIDRSCASILLKYFTIISGDFYYRPSCSEQFRATLIFSHRLLSLCASDELLTFT